MQVGEGWTEVEGPLTNSISHTTSAFREGRAKRPPLQEGLEAPF